ncbi:MAG TPA: outer membrane lipoprotein-sorting protein [Gammaproteobacteria bacterium]|nr:outer membrane lipoprotein-sorting protein [Gammaproteobacteria bacterium]
MNLKLLPNRLIASLLLLFPLVAPAESPDGSRAEPDAGQKGLEIAREADRRDRGFHDSTATMRMVLRNRQGKESVREIRVKTLEQENDGDKSLTIFDSPSDVKGTKFLSFTHKTGPDDQWLYLPALKRVKRISSRNKSGPFMGSEFAYEDISSQEVEKYTYKYLRDEACGEGGLECFVIERYPVDPNSGYTRQVVWIDKQEYRPWKIEFYDRKNARLKTLTFSNYKQYLGRYWRALDMNMENHQTGKSTHLSWSDYRFQTGLTERDFDRSALKRAR